MCGVISSLAYNDNEEQVTLHARPTITYIRLQKPTSIQNILALEDSLQAYTCHTKNDYFCEIF